MYTIRTLNNIAKTGLAKLPEQNFVIDEKAENPDVERLREIVSTMSERQKQVYQLHFIEGFSVKETAAILGMSSPAVTKHKQRVIEIIKKNFQRG